MVDGMSLSEPKQIPLFLKTFVFSNYNTRQNGLHYNVKLINALHNYHGLQLDESKLILTQDMMDEFLKKTHRPGRWDNEDKLKVGEPWYFTWHQYRRTFAFLAINSGMVSLSSLKRQLAHGLMETSAYYSHGAINIEPLITDGKNHIAKEIEEQREEQAAIALAYNVLTNKAYTTEILDKWA